MLKRIKANPMHFCIGLGMIGIGVWLSLNDHYFTWPPGLRDFANEDAVDMLFVVTGASMALWTLDDYRTPTWDHIQLVSAAMLLSALTMYQLCHWFVTGAPMPWISNGVITAYVVILAKRSDSGHAMAGPDTQINK